MSAFCLMVAAAPVVESCSDGSALVGALPEPVAEPDPVTGLANSAGAEDVADSLPDVLTVCEALVEVPALLVAADECTVALAEVWLVLGCEDEPNEIVCVAVLAAVSEKLIVWWAAISQATLVQSVLLNVVLSTGEGECRLPDASAFATTTVLRSLKLKEHWPSEVAPALHSTM